MNPDSNEFEKLQRPEWAVEQEKILSEQLRQVTADRDELLQDPQQLLRPDGSPVPKHWSVFTVGEHVVIKDYTFEVVDVSKDRILFKPIGLPIVGEK